MSKEEFTKSVLEAELSLYRVAKSILNNDEDCADAIQSAILKAWEKRNSLKNIDFFKTWLTRILINECCRMIRLAKRYVLYEDYPGWHVAEAEPLEEASELLRELALLDEKYRIPIVLHELEGYSVKEISRILKLTEANVRNRLFRGKAQLKKNWKGEM